MKRNRLGALVCFWILAAAGCVFVPGNDTKDAGNSGIISIMTWNVQNLFDGTDNGAEYNEYLSSAGWNEKKYEARILSISAAMESAFSAGEFGSSAPVLIGIIEVENQQVLEDLAVRLPAKYGYNYVFFGNLPGMSLGVGVISRLPFQQARVHSITVGGETTPRPVAEVELLTENGNIVFFICHWKSKLGGDEETELLRRASARVINRRTVEIHREYPDKPVIIMGDLNENHDEFFRSGGKYLSALLPDDPEAGKMSALQNSGDFILVSGGKPPVIRFFDDDYSSPVFYSPWGNEINDGSYYYKNEWETIDHFLLSAELFNGSGWDYFSCHVLAAPPFTNSSGFPVSFTPRNGIGLSDHLPLMLYLKSCEK